MTTSGILRGREALVAKITEFEAKLGRGVLLVSGVGDHPQVLPSRMPERYTSTNYHGDDTTNGGELAAVVPALADSAILLGLAFVGPRAGENGTGAYAAYWAPGEIEEHLMSSDPDALPGRKSTVHIVDSLGWEPNDSQVAEDSSMGEPLRYAWRKHGSVAVLATIDLLFEDIEGVVDYVENPAMFHHE